MERIVCLFLDIRNMLYSKYGQAWRAVTNFMLRRYKGSDGYIILLPELPNSASDSALFPINEYPNYQKLNQSNLISGMAQLAIESELRLSKHLSRMADRKWRSAKTFELVFDPIEEAVVPLNFAFRTIANLRLAQCDRFIRLAYERLADQTNRILADRFMDPNLYLVVKELEKETTLSAEQRQLIRVYDTNLGSFATHFNKKNQDKVFDLLRRLESKKNEFRFNVAYTQSKFQHNISNFDSLTECPSWLIWNMTVDKLNVVRGPWRVTLDPTIYHDFMRYCSDRMIRWNTWRAMRNRASTDHLVTQHSNSRSITDLRYMRRGIARLYGFSNWAQYACAKNTAVGQVDAAVTFLDALKKPLREVASKQLNQLNEFAGKETAAGGLQSWDLPYWSRKYVDDLLQKGNCDVLNRLSPLQLVDKLFSAYNNLFGLKFENCTGAVSLWNSSVLFYKVLAESGGHLGSIYIDLYQKPGMKLSSWSTLLGRDRSKRLGSTPIVYVYGQFPVIGNASKPDVQSSVDVYSFKNFATVVGSAIHQVLLNSDFAELNNLSALNLEAQGMFGCAFAQMATSEWFLRYLFQETNPQQLVVLSKALKFGNALDFANDAMISAFDLELFISDPEKVPGWGTVQQRVWKEFQPENLPVIEDDNEPCSNLDVFGGSLSGTYFTKLYAEALAADIVSTMNTRSHDAQALHASGRLLRDSMSHSTILSAPELHRQIVGKDLSQSSLITFLNSQG